MAFIWSLYTLAILTIFKEPRRIVTTEELQIVNQCGRRQNSLNYHTKSITSGNHESTLSQCLNNENNDTHIECINLNYGYQTCDACYKKNIGKTYIKNWFVANNFLPCKLFLNTILKDHNYYTQNM